MENGFHDSNEGWTRRKISRTEGTLVKCVCNVNRTKVYEVYEEQ